MSSTCERNAWFVITTHEPAGNALPLALNEPVARCTWMPEYCSALMNLVAVGKSFCALLNTYARGSRFSGFLSSAM